MIRVTADSNVYISALVFGGKPLRVVELATEGAIRLTISEPLIAETRRVLECAVAGRAEFVVTGDGDLLVLQNFRGIPIVTVAVFLERFDAGQ